MTTFNAPIHSTAVAAPPADDQPPTTPFGAAVQAAAEHYYLRWNWTIVITGTRLLLVPDSTISAVEMRASLAADVQKFLTLRLMTPPVILLPGSRRRRVLLTTSADDAAQVSVERLEGHGVTTHRSGAFVPLPPSHLKSGAVTWQLPPTVDRPALPPFTAIVAAVRSIAEPAGQS